jgi:hypothetical protein
VEDPELTATAAMIAFVLATAVGPAVTFARFFYRTFTGRVTAPSTTKTPPVND